MITSTCARSSGGCSTSQKPASPALPRWRPSVRNSVYSPRKPCTRSVAPPRPGELDCTRTPGISATICVRSPGRTAFFSPMSSPASTSTRSGTASTRCSVRVAVTMIGATDAACSMRVNAKAVSVFARSRSVTESERKPILLATIVRCPAGTVSVTWPPASVCAPICPLRTKASDSGPLTPATAMCTCALPESAIVGVEPAL